MSEARDERSDEALMRAYCEGEGAAFEEIFHRYGPRLLRVIRRQVRSEEDAREIVQQTFLNLHRARRDFREGSSLRPWVFTIALNLKREHFRKRARRPEAPLELDGRSDPQQAPYDPLRRERAEELRSALAALPANQREVIELHWFSDLPFAEVAAVVGASVSAVKVRAHRGYQRLRRALAESSVDERNQTGSDGIPGEEP